MMKHFLIVSALLVSVSAVEAKTRTKRAAKLSKEDAKELCLVTKGAAISKKDLKKCTTKAMRTGKV